MHQKHILSQIGRQGGLDAGHRGGRSEQGGLQGAGTALGIQTHGQVQQGVQASQPVDDRREPDLSGAAIPGGQGQGQEPRLLGGPQQALPQAAHGHAGAQGLQPDRQGQIRLAGQPGDQDHPAVKPKRGRHRIAPHRAPGRPGRG